MKPSVDFRARVEELRSLASARPRRKDREIVAAALGCKWEGLQSVAAQTLSRWGDRESIETLREFWFLCQNRKRNGTIGTVAGVVARLLSACVGAQDANWVLDCYFEIPNSGNGSFLGVVKSLPLESARERLLQESRSPDHKRRLAALDALGRMPFPDRRALLKRFLDDEDGLIRGIAHHLDQPLFPGEKDD